MAEPMLAQGADSLGQEALKGAHRDKNAVDELMHEERTRDPEPRGEGAGIELARMVRRIAHAHIKPSAQRREDAAPPLLFYRR